MRTSDCRKRSARDAGRATKPSLATRSHSPGSPITISAALRRYQPSSVPRAVSQIGSRVISASPGRFLNSAPRACSSPTSSATTPVGSRCASKSVVASTSSRSRPLRPKGCVEAVAGSAEQTGAKRVTGDGTIAPVPTKRVTDGCGEETRSADDRPVRSGKGFDQCLVNSDPTVPGEDSEPAIRTTFTIEYQSPSCDAVLIEPQFAHVGGSVDIPDEPKRRTGVHCRSAEFRRDGALEWGPIGRTVVGWHVHDCCPVDASRWGRSRFVTRTARGIRS